MTNIRVVAEMAAMDSLIKRATANTSDIELQSHWASYFTVKIAGILENALTILYSDYVNRSAGGPVANYAISRLETLQNPKAEKFVQIARHFNPAWATSLEEYLEDEGRKEAIDSIMTVRHQVAHGGKQGITLARISSYYAKAKDVLDFIEVQLA